MFKATVLHQVLKSQAVGRPHQGPPFFSSTTSEKFTLITPSQTVQLPVDLAAHLTASPAVYTARAGAGGGVQISRMLPLVGLIKQIKLVITREVLFWGSNLESSC
jgi:hypothetical protein